MQITMSKQDGQSAEKLDTTVEKGVLEVFGLSGDDISAGAGSAENVVGDDVGTEDSTNSNDAKVSTETGSEDEKGGATGGQSSEPNENENGNVSAETTVEPTLRSESATTSFSIVKSKKNPVAVEGKDFIRDSETGRITVLSKFIQDDIETITNTSCELFLKIFKSKKNRQNAELIAECLGFEADKLRTAGENARDLIKGISVAMQKGDEDLLDEYRAMLPDGLRYQDADVYSYKPKDGESEEKKDLYKPGNALTKDEVDNAVASAVSQNLYKVLKPSMTKDEVEVVRKDLIEKIKDDSAAYQFILKPRFSPDTGKELSLTQKLEEYLETSQYFAPEKEVTVSTFGGGKGSPAKAGEAKTKIEKQLDNIFGN